MTLVAKAGQRAGAGFRPARRISVAGPWRPAADRAHGIAAIGVLSGTALLCLASPPVGEALRTSSGIVLLVAGALIGVPHGSSDFVVAYRLMRPAWGRSWLPVFLAVYLAFVALTLAAWSALPLATLVGFLTVSGLHFGSGDLRATAPSGIPGLDFALRATTPILPIFLIHPGGVAGFIAALGGLSEPATLHLLAALRWPLLLPWGAALAAVTLPGLLSGGRRSSEAAELLSIALAAAVLPPLLGFALYFCLVHAVRHMLEIAAEHHPTRPRAAAALAAGIVGPSALACLAALCLAWNRLDGPLDTQAMITWSLRGIAALTVPHMALELWAARRPSGDAASRDAA